MPSKGAHSYSDGNITLRGDLTDVIIGKFCSIAGSVAMDCGFSHNTKLVTTFPFEAKFPERFGHLKTHFVSKGNIVIGNDVWIGEHVLVMSGVHVGDGAVLAARAVVTKNVRPYEIVAGIPARHIKFRFSQKIIDKLLIMKWWDWPEEKIFERVPLLMSENYEELFRLEGL